jgi:hypothetical protein
MVPMPRKNNKPQPASDSAHVRIVLAAGRPQPQLTLNVAPGTHERSLMAALYRIAAEAEQRSVFESWTVRVQLDEPSSGRIILQLAGAAPEPGEAQRGEAMLLAILAGAR